ncbi:MAG: hypothetical protein ABSH28_07685 [Acidobacteriota bacterium]|jgi:hypothetical protein
MLLYSTHFREHPDGGEKRLVVLLGLGPLDERQSGTGVNDCGAFHGTAARYGIEPALV